MKGSFDPPILKNSEIPVNRSPPVDVVTPPPVEAKKAPPPPPVKEKKAPQSVEEKKPTPPPVDEKKVTPTTPKATPAAAPSEPPKPAAPSLEEQYPPKTLPDGECYSLLQQGDQLPVTRDSADDAYHSRDADDVCYSSEGVSVVSSVDTDVGDDTSSVGV